MEKQNTTTLETMNQTSIDYRKPLNAEGIAEARIQASKEARKQRSFKTRRKCRKFLAKWISMRIPDRQKKFKNVKRFCHKLHIKVQDVDTAIIYLERKGFNVIIHTSGEFVISTPRL